MEEKLKPGNNQQVEKRSNNKEQRIKRLIMKVLVVDDSPLILSKISELLEDLESITTLSTTGNYEDAIEQFNTLRPNVALLDINLPTKNGIDLLQYVKANAPETTVIMFTNQSSDYYRNLCLKMGADHFLDKSKDFDSIPLILTALS